MTCYFAIKEWAYGRKFTASETRSLISLLDANTVWYGLCLQGFPVPYGSGTTSTEASLGLCLFVSFICQLSLT